MTRRFVCVTCGNVHAAWQARCAACSSMDGLRMEREAAGVEAPSVPTSAGRFPSRPVEPVADPPVFVVDEPELLSEVSARSFVRYSTGLLPVDHVLGGGLVEASVVLLAANPGTGKTTLSFQVLAGLQRRALYVTGEETVNQVAETARRIGATNSDKLFGWAAYDLDMIFARAQALRVQIMAIDSIQKMVCADVSGRAGSPTQLRECTARLVHFAKSTKTALWLIGHVTSDGDIAGPKTVEHDVDVVLELEQGTGLEGRERLLKNPSKNRFGPTGTVGRLELTDRGLVCVDGDGWNETL